jgi:hypothetical protein
MESEPLSSEVHAKNFVLRHKMLKFFKILRDALGKQRIFNVPTEMNAIALDPLVGVSF